MDRMLLFGGNVFTESGEFQTLNILIENGKISALLPQDEVPQNAELIDCSGRFITPGFIDIHIHGREGFEASEDVDFVARAVARHGVTSFLPTTLTDSFDRTLDTLSYLADYISSGTTDGAAEPLGIYSEGMYFSGKKAGAQNPEFIKDEIKILELEKMIEKGKGKLKVVALAPEIKNSEAAIKYLRENNVIPSIAHTNATAKEAQTGIEAGILGATHTFNAMSGMSHNELGAAGTAVFNPDIYCELIADGYHVNPEFINILFNFKPLDKIILISDNVGAAGTPVGDTELGGVPVINTGDRLLVKSSGHLAGSCLRLCDAVKNVMRFTGLSAEQIIPCLSENPAKYIGVFERKGSITKGKDADLNIFNSKFDLISTVVRGKII